MSRRNPPAKWVLPQVVNPPDRVCYTIQVPNERAHIGAFLGSLYMLTSAIFWQDDIAHTAKDVALVWRDIYDQLKKNQCGNTAAIVNTYEEFIDMVAFREDCDCNLFYKCCDGTEKQVATKDMINQPGQQTSAPQPPAGGGTQQYCRKLNANNQWRLPVVVNAGDVITLDSFSGAGSDDGTPGNEWYCFNGTQFFIECGASAGHLDGTDPLPTANHMSGIVYIAGAWYSLLSGSVTVPGGVSNATATIQVNDADITNNPGDYELCVTVKNNQAAAWTHEFDLELSSDGWTIITPAAPCAVPFGQWSAGQGFVSTLAVCTSPTNTYRALYMKRDFAHTTISSITITSTYAAGTIADTTAAAQVLQGRLSGSNVFSAAIPVGTMPNPYNWSGSADIDEIVLDLAPGYAFSTTDPGGSCAVTKIVIQGYGIDPF